MRTCIRSFYIFYVSEKIGFYEYNERIRNVYQGDDIFKSLNVITRVYVCVCICLSGRLLFWNAALNRMNLLENCLGLFSLDWYKIKTP